MSTVLQNSLINNSFSSYLDFEESPTLEIPSPTSPIPSPTFCATSLTTLTIPLAAPTSQPINHLAVPSRGLHLIYENTLIEFYFFHFNSFNFKKITI